MTRRSRPSNLIRARGLGDLATAYERQELSGAERRWLAGLVELESRESAILTGLVEQAIAGESGDFDRSLGELDALRAERLKLSEDPEFAGTIAKLVGGYRGSEDLGHLAELVKASGIPVLLYWVTQTNVIVWVVSPEGMEVKSVFLPEAAVVEKVRRVVSSSRTPDQPFDAAAARQLYAYLVQPFERHLVGREVIVVPQGPLVPLPFEALIDPRTGSFLVEKVAVSYAPSAAFAARAVQRRPIAMPRVTALYDEAIELDTGEIAGLMASLTSGLDATASVNLSGDQVIDLIAGRSAVHVLLHGFFERNDPLQSYVDLNNPELPPADNALTTAELLAANWRDARLVVFSSCESAQLDVRISNEVYGLSWAPLVGGAQAVVMSRWRVEGKSNADWMKAFYARLAAGAGSPAVAAADTMKLMIHDGRTEPYYWAGPQVFGR